MTGSGAAELFYDDERFQRAGAAPEPLLKTLFGVGGVHGLDDGAHRRRKELFVSLMTAKRVKRLSEVADGWWRTYAESWQTADRVVLYEASRAEYDVPEQDLRVDRRRLRALPRSGFIMSNVRVRDLTAATRLVLVRMRSGQTWRQGMRRRLMALAGVTAAGAGAYAVAQRIALREDLDWASVPKPGAVMEIEGYGVHYTDEGSGAAVLLIHGFGGHTHHFRNLAPAIAAAGHRVIAVDLKGYGYSERDAAAGLSFTDQVRMLGQLLDRLGVERVTVAGHSMGGVVGQRFAATYPGRTDALVLMASTSGDEGLARRMPPAPLAKAVAPLLAWVVAGRMLSASYYDRSRLTAELRAAYLRPARLRGSMAGLFASMRDRARDGVIERGNIAAPVLVLAAAEDRLVPLATAQRLRDLLPDARLVVVPEAGHALYDDQPEATASAILSFLRETGGVAAAV